jgi:peroxiredoxin
MMKPKMMFVALFAGALMVSMKSPDYSRPAAGKTLPSVVLKKMNGESVNIQDYTKKDKVIILSFWASWCSPCKRELDAIAEIYPEWQEKYDVELIAITIDNARALSKVRPIIEQKAWPFEILSDVNQEMQQALNFQAIPQTYVVSKNGEITYEHSGYQPGDEYELEEFLETLE